MYNTLRTKLRTALQKKDVLTKDFCRSILSRISEYQVEQKIEKGVCDDNTVSKIVGIYKKGLEKALDSFRKGGQSEGELFDQYGAEIKLCEDFLPKRISTDKLETQIREKLIQFNITETNKAGKIIGIIIKNNPPDTVNGKQVKDIIKKILEA